MERLKLFIVVLVFSTGFAYPQATVPESEKWPDEVKEVVIRSTLDGKDQPAMFYCPKSDKPVPLLVGLHSWSADYRQSRGIPYARWCIENKWAFIHPNFRGPNNKPEACGSQQVLQDITDAVEYAKKTAKIDPRRVYLVGLSGGGYAAMLMAGKKPELWAGVSAWVGISDLRQWHEQCVASASPYTEQIEKSCGGKPADDKKVLQEYEQRSAITWIQNARKVPMQISAGIGDDCVPVSHSINVFNALARPQDRIGCNDIKFMVEKREIPKSLKRNIKDDSYGKNPPLLRRTSNNVELTIFKGGHEIVYQAALAWLKRIDQKHNFRKQN